MTYTAIDLVLENLTQLINYEHNMFPCKKDIVESLYEKLQVLRVFLNDPNEKHNEHKKVKDLVGKIADVTCQIDDIIDWFALNGHVLIRAFDNFSDFSALLERYRCPWLMFSGLILDRANCPERLRPVIEEIEPHLSEKIHAFRTAIEEVDTIKAEVMEIYRKEMFGIGSKKIGKSSAAASSRVSSPMVQEESVVGFDDEKTTIIDLLTREHEKELKVIPIIGMPGLGKTTLANKVYGDPLIEYYFYIRGWTYVSQVYQKRDLLVGIFYSAFQIRDEVSKMSDEMLGEELYKRLKGKRYLIVMDDIWNIGALEDIKRYLPNDNNGSRIMLTSRLALHANSHHLRFLNDDESWELLQKKAFGRETCPPELIEIGKQIAQKCEGLPLAILVVSGLLVKKDKTEDWWRHVAESVGSGILSDTEQYMGTLALSYNHLPYYLKSCFLYLGAFPEDYEIPVQKLIWLWIAEGFVRKNEQKSLEAVAEDYLMDLTERSLLIVSKRRSNGGIKACRIHDLLRDLCLRKAREENFLQLISRYDQISLVTSSSCKDRRLCIHSNLIDYPFLKLYAPHALHIRSFLSLSFDDSKELGVLFACKTFKLLRILDVSSITIPGFPEEIQMLLHLRYLALHVLSSYFTPSTSNLFNLETLIFEGEPFQKINLEDIWKMVKLRHLYTKCSLELPLTREKCSIWGFVEGSDLPILVNLQTISSQYLYGGEEQVLVQFPNLKKLKYESDHFHKLGFLLHLETLNVTYDVSKTGLVRFPHLNEFPPNLRKLTLSDFRLPWKKMSTLGRLPNLEVLKLYKAFEGSSWDTRDGEFCKLRFLKFEGLDIKQWTASSDHFANLQTLVLEDCRQLEEIPFGLGDVATLEVIELRYCSHSAENSARQIQEEQESMGNDGLKVIIHPWDHDDLADEFANMEF